MHDGHHDGDHDDLRSPMFSSGSITDPLRFLFGPGPDEAACLAVTPWCMGLLPYLGAMLGVGS